MSTLNETMRIVEALDEAVQNRDTHALRALYADDAVVWHGATNREQGVDENISMLAAHFLEMAEISYTDVRRNFFEGGFVQQHRLVRKHVDGSVMPDVHACAVFKVSGGKIVRIDEYFDASELKDHWRRLSERAAEIRGAGGV